MYSRAHMKEGLLLSSVKEENRRLLCLMWDENVWPVHGIYAATFNVSFIFCDLFQLLITATAQPLRVGIIIFPRKGTSSK